MNFAEEDLVFTREWTRMHANSRSQPIEGSIRLTRQPAKVLKSCPKRNMFPCVVNDFIRVHSRAFAVQIGIRSTLKSLIARAPTSWSSPITVCLNDRSTFSLAGGPMKNSTCLRGDCYLLSAATGLTVFCSRNNVRSLCLRMRNAVP